MPRGAMSAEGNRPFDKPQTIMALTLSVIAQRTEQLVWAYFGGFLSVHKLITLACI